MAKKQKKKAGKNTKNNLSVEDITRIIRGYTDEPGLEMPGVRNLPNSKGNMTVNQRDALRDWWMKNKAKKYWSGVPNEDFGGEFGDINYGMVSNKLKAPGGKTVKRNSRAAQKAIGEAKNKWGEAVRDIPRHERIKAGLPTKDVMWDSGGISDRRKQNLKNNPEYGLGGLISGLYSAGKSVDKTLFPKNPETGEYESDLQASLSFGFTDPSQNINQVLHSYEEGNIEQAILEMNLPGYAGLNYQDRAEDRLTNKEKKLRQADLQKRTPDQFQNQYTSPYQMAEGGMVNTNSELEKGEVYRTPAGEIRNVPEGTPTHKNGGIDMNLPEGTEILGKLKNSNNEKYKDLGKRMEKAYDNYKKIMKGTPTPIAKRTAEKNLEKLQREYTQLMQEQESKKTGGNNNQEFGPGGISDLDRLYPSNTSSTFTSLDDIVYTLNSQPQGFQGFDTSIDTSSPDALADMSSSMNNDPTGGGGYFQGMGAENWAAAGAQALPALYNIGQGLFGKEKDYKSDFIPNRQAEKAIDLASDRRYNADPELRRADLMRSIQERNLRESASSASQYLGNLAGIQAQDRRTTADIMSRKQNADNQYMMQEAQMRSNLGSQEAQRRQQLKGRNQQLQAKTEAAKQQMLSQGLGQLGQTAAGVNQDMMNARNTQMMQDALNQYLQDYNINLSGEGKPIQGDYQRQLLMNILRQRSTQQ